MYEKINLQPKNSKNVPKQHIKKNNKNGTYKLCRYNTLVN